MVRVVLIEEKTDGIFLTCIDATGRVVGDTWHKSVDDAIHQAEFEYGDNISDCIEVPDEADGVEFSVSLLGRLS